MHTKKTFAGWCGCFGEHAPPTLTSRTTANITMESAPKRRRLNTTATTTVELHADAYRSISWFLPPIARTQFKLASKTTSALFDMQSELRHWRRVILQALGPVDPVSGVDSVECLKEQMGSFWEAGDIRELWCLYWIVSAGKFSWLKEGYDATAAPMLYMPFNKQRVYKAIWLFKHMPSRRYLPGARFKRGDFYFGTPSATWNRATARLAVSDTFHVKWPQCYRFPRDGRRNNDGYFPLLSGPREIIQAMLGWFEFSKYEILPGLHRTTDYDEFEHRVAELAYQLELRHRRLVELYSGVAPHDSRSKTGVGIIINQHVHRYQTKHGHLYVPYGCHEYGLVKSYAGPFAAAQRGIDMCIGMDYGILNRIIFITFLEWILTIEDEPPGVEIPTESVSLPTSTDFKAAIKRGSDAIAEYALCCMKFHYARGKTQYMGGLGSAGMEKYPRAMYTDQFLGLSTYTFKG